MNWRIDYSRDAEKFISKQDIRNEVREGMRKFLLKMKGENVNIHLKKLEGEWEGYYRLSKGKLRIIFGVDRVEKVLFVEREPHRPRVMRRWQ